MPENDSSRASGGVLTSRWNRPVRTVYIAPLITLVLVGLAWMTPKFTADPFWLSFVPTVLVLLLAAMHVWLLLRVDLLSFASPAFMAVGGYTLALIAMNVTSNAIVLLLACFVVPAVLALPLGLVLLRLRGTYFALVTFVLAQVVMLVVIIAEDPLGGSSGISGIPGASLGSTEFVAEGALVRFSVAVGLIGVAVAAVVSVACRRHFAAIEENEALAASLGLRPWLYKTIAFVAAAGMSGLAGLILVNQLGNAHPDSFQPLSAVNHVAAAVLGGPAVFGPVIGAVILAWLTHTFASQAQYSQMLLGAALIVATLFARRGASGLIEDGAGLIRRRREGSSSEVVLDHEDDTARVSATPRARREPVDPSAEVVLRVEGLSKHFGGVKAVDDITFDLRRGEVLGVIGPNGAGKTTMINLVSGAHQPTSGSVEVGGKRITGVSPQEVNRHGIARSYQQTSVFAGVTVRENLARGRAFSKRWIGDDELASLLELTGLSRHLDATAGDLPYGLQKLLGLILPLATEPVVILLDEPAAGLEVSERGRIDQLVDWAVERGTAVLLVEHDMDLVRRICPRLLVMDTGKELAAGSPDTVLREPAVVTAYLGVPVDDDEVEESALVDTAPGTTSGAHNE